MIKIYILAVIKKAYWIKPLGENSEQELTFAQMDPNAMYVTFKEIIPFKNYDITIAEKIISYQKSKSIVNLSQKYFHKNPPNLNTPKQILGFYERIFNKQEKEIDKLGLRNAVQFEINFSPYLYQMNKGKFKVNQKLIRKIHAEAQALKDATFNPVVNTKNQLSKYIKGKYYQSGLMKHYNIHQGRISFKHKELAKLNDQTVNMWIANQQAKQKISEIHPLIDQNEVDINHRQYCTVTGRIHTYAPNVIGLTKYLETDYSLDFVAQETMIYMHSFKPKVYELFSKHKLKDINGLLCQQVFGLKTHPDEVKLKHPKERDFIKIACLSMMNGQTREQFLWKLEDKNKISIFDKLLESLEFEDNRKKLFSFVRKNSAFLMVPQLQKVGRTPMTIDYELRRRDCYDFAEDGSFEAKPNNAYNRSFFITEKEQRLEIMTKVMNRYIQSQGSVVQKMAIMECMDFLVKNKIDNKIIMSRHDQILFQNENGKEGLIEAMKRGYRLIMKHDINVD